MAVNVEALSNTLGWISIASWLIVLAPQFHKNYRLRSGDGLSMSFIMLWLVADLLSLAGAILGKLLSTIIALAIFYGVCDLCLILQILHYRNWIFKRSSGGRSSMHDQMHLKVPYSRRIWPYVSGVLFLLFVGIIAYVVNTRRGHHLRSSLKASDWKVQLLGWCSAVLFVAGRISQIVKNMRTRCQGLSPLLFFFAIWGNGAYVASILVESVAKDYLVKNSSWLAGGVLAMLCDVIILSQFICFSRSLQSSPNIAASRSAV